MDKSDFVKDFSEFYVELRKEGIETLADITMLYAIYRKDLRAEKFNGSADGDGSKSRQSNPNIEPATERQKQYIMDLAYKSGVCIAEKELDKMTRAQASRTIDALLGGD